MKTEKKSTATKVKCKICEKITAIRQPNGEGTAFLPRRHNTDGFMCMGNELEGELIDVEVGSKKAPALSRAHSLVGFNNDGGRPENDFYPTPPEATLGLLKKEGFVGDIWECACGNGAMSIVLDVYLKKNGHKILSTDLEPRGYGTQLNFLESFKLLAPNIVTNPPFKIMQEFATHALMLQCKKLCLFGKLAFLTGVDRTRWLETTPFKYAYVFRNRISLYRNGIVPEDAGGGMMDFAWYVWEAGFTGEPVIRWV